jgi:hypothetical protein
MPGAAPVRRLPHQGFFWIESPPGSAFSRRMKITIEGTGDRFREVTFLSADDDETLARSGLLTRDEALDFAGDLHDVADQLTRWARRQTEDAGQTVLPFFGGIAA